MKPLLALVFLLVGSGCASHHFVDAGGLWRVDREARLTVVDEFVGTPGDGQFSFDEAGNTLAFVRLGNLSVVDLRSYSVRTVTNIASAQTDSQVAVYVSLLGLSPDGRQALVEVGHSDPHCDDCPSDLSVPERYYGTGAIDVASGSLRPLTLPGRFVGWTRFGVLTVTNGSNGFDGELLRVPELGGAPIALTSKRGSYSRATPTCSSATPYLLTRNFLDLNGAQGSEVLAISRGGKLASEPLAIGDFGAIQDPSLSCVFFASKLLSYRALGEIDSEGLRSGAVVVDGRKLIECNGHSAQTWKHWPLFRSLLIVRCANRLEVFERSHRRVRQVSRVPSAVLKPETAVAPRTSRARPE
jgi:hypothetical protein